MPLFKIQNIHDGPRSFMILEGEFLSAIKIEPAQYICIQQNGANWNIRINDVFLTESSTQIEISKSDFEGLNPELVIGNSFPIKGGANLALTSYGFGVSWWLPFLLLVVLGFLVWMMVFVDPSIFFFEIIKYLF